MAFQTTVTGEGAQTIIRLTDTSSGTVAEVYSFGALLNAFTISLPRENLNVIDGFHNTTEAAQTITPAFKSAKLSPFVCRIKAAQYHFGEKDFQLSKYWMNGSAIHGLVYDTIFTVVETSGDESSASVKLQYDYNKKDEGYPFHYRCEVTYTLEANNSLQLTTEIFNLDEGLIPVADGWHPYFTLGDPLNECQLEFQSKEMLEFDEGLIPTGKLIPYQEFGSIKDFGTTWFDNCFTLNFAECQPMCVFRNPKRKVEIEIYPDPSYPYLQFFTPAHRKSIAIENLSAAPDAFNNALGLHVLEPNQSISFSTKFVVRCL